MNLERLTEKILKGYLIDKSEAMALLDSDLDTLTDCADKIREHFNSDSFDLCTIINGKSGRCSEDCKFCAQSAHHKTDVEEYPLLSDEELIEGAKYNADKGILRYSIVTSGRSLPKNEVKKVSESYLKIKEQVDIHLCASHGLLEYEDFVLLKESGVTRYHNNLESSRRFFPEICSTHTYDEKIRAIKDAQKAGLSVCSGGIMGLGETMEDRIDMAFELRELGITSIPINVLNPIPGTPFANNPKLTADDVRRIVAIYRFIHPKSAIRMAGGRGLLLDKGKSVFRGGANAAISGDMLTTAGISIQHDIDMAKELGYQIEQIN